MKSAVYAEQGLCAACLFVVLVAIVDKLRGASPGNVWRVHRATLALLIVGGAARLAMPPAFIHANFHGYGIVEAILAFPAPAHYRAEYGQGSFMALGALATALGDGWHSVELANALVGTALLSSMALLAHRIAGPFAATATAAAGALFTPLVRMAASEDAHGVASLLAVVALLAAAPRPASLSRSRVIVIVAATLGAVYSRQTWFFLPLIVAGLTLDSWRPPRLAQPRVLLLLALVVLLLVPRAVSLATTNDRGSVTHSFSALFSSALPIWFRYHPLLRIDLGPWVVGFGVMGAAWAVRSRQRLGSWVAIGAAMAFVSSLVVSANPSYGVAYGFRMPLFALLLPLAGTGCAAALDAVRRRAPAWAIPFAVASILALLFWPLPGLVREARLRDPQDQEYAILASHAGTLPRGTTLLFPRSEGREPPSYSVPESALRDAGVTARLGAPTDTAQEGLIVYEGLGCHAYSLSERTGILPAQLVEHILEGRDRKGRWLVDLLWTTDSGAFDYFDVPPPEGRRPECTRAILPGSTFEEWGRVEIPRRRDLPFVYFPESSMTVGVWKAPRATAP